MPPHPATACLAEDELLALGHGRSLADAPAAEAHLADCATCSALLASVVRATPPWNELAGSMLGPYRLEAQIGAGGMGAVYRARDTRLDRTIAVKVLHTEASATRLASEARAAAAIDHPAVVAIHDVGVSDGITYVAMELVEGESLRSVIDRGAVTVARARGLAIELAEALAAAHARGVIHRDLKPENLVVAADGRLRILDFGLAKLLDAGPLDATEPGTIQGTAGYMAPEQARGEPADARVDLFATGAIVYELVTGRRAFGGATHADRLSAVLRDEPALDGLGELAAIVERCLAKEPRDRFQSAADLGWTLRRGSPRIVAAKPAPVSRRAILLGTGAAALTGLGGYLLGRGHTLPRHAAHPAFHQLTYRTGRVFTARFTRDGSRVVFGAAWDGDPLRAYTIDLAGGAASPLELAADPLAISARGEVAASLDRRFTDQQSATGTLAVMPLGGGVPRVLAEGVQDADYAPDGTLAIIRRTAEGFRLEHPIGTALVETRGWITHVRVAPDGKRLAYIEHPHVNDDAGSLMVLDVTTRAVRALSKGWSSIAGLAWHPSGESIWFTAGRTHAQNEVHAITLGGTIRTIGQTTGRLRLHDLASDPASAERAVVSVDAWRMRTLVGGPAGEHDRSLSEVSLVIDLSADGSRLVTGELGQAETERGAYLVPVDGGPPLRLGDGFPLAISPSGLRVAANVFEGETGRLVAYSSASGDRPVIPAPGHVMSARWIDESTLVASAAQQVWRLSLTEAPIALTAPGVAGRLVIAPDRRRCAFVDAAGRVQVCDLTTGTVQTLPGTFPRQIACGWLAEPDAIVIRTPTTPLQLTRLDPVTGATARHREIQPPPVGLKAVDSLVLHADGVRYAYSYGQELSQLYVMTFAGEANA